MYKVQKINFDWKIRNLMKYYALKKYISYSKIKEINKKKRLYA